ncbi:MAG: OmpA family protein [Nannocystaceae bacterium]|nr:OmpA family protein [Myxococcales bacterium]
MRTATMITLTTLTLLAACAKEKGPVVHADTAPPVEGNVDGDGKDPSKAKVSIDRKVAELCNLPAPNFSFDSARLAKDAKASLDALAECFLTGKAKDKNMNLVGHADPRGDEEYNMGLGQRRADTVAGYLRKRGLGRDRVETSSRGEMDAKGTDDASWSEDRKVEIFLAE